MPFQLSIKDFLSDVNDYLNKEYIDEEGKPNYGVYTKNGVMYLQPGEAAFSFHQIIGKQGAHDLDKAQEVTTRLVNLNVARQMEEAGKDALTIKLATGWERGADKLWKYEIDDTEAAVSFDGDIYRRMNDKKYQRWLELNQQLNDDFSIMDSDEYIQVETLIVQITKRSLAKSKPVMYNPAWICRGKNARKPFSKTPKMLPVKTRYSCAMVVQSSLLMFRSTKTPNIQ